MRDSNAGDALVADSCRRGGRLFRAPLSSDASVEHFKTKGSAGSSSDSRSVACSSSRHQSGAAELHLRPHTSTSGLRIEAKEQAYFDALHQQLVDGHENQGRQALFEQFQPQRKQSASALTSRDACTSIFPEQLDVIRASDANAPGVPLSQCVGGTGKPSRIRWRSKASGKTIASERASGNGRKQPRLQGDIPALGNLGSAETRTSRLHHNDEGSSTDWMYDLILTSTSDEEGDERGRAQLALSPQPLRKPPRFSVAKNGWAFFMSDDNNSGGQQPIFPPSPGSGGDDSPGGPPDDPTMNPGYPVEDGDALSLVLPLLILLSTLIFILLLSSILVLVLRRQSRISLSEQDGPVDITCDEEDVRASVAVEREEMFLQGLMDEAVRQGYRRASDWFLANPPASVSTDITLSQFLSIQEKGVSAWSFDPDYESNPSVFVEARTEITFLADGAGMAPQEGGGVCVQSNLPVPKLNEVYYWEVKMFNKPDTTNVAIGLTTKPYPSFRFPGFHKYSIGFYSADGSKCHNHPWAAQSYGPAYVQGDVIGVGYRPRSGTVFFTRNGKKLEDAFVGLNRHNFFPTVGADGQAEIHVNFGQAGFVFIEANVKKWGLAPMAGTLAPPPAYGHEGGSILIESGQQQLLLQSTSGIQHPQHQHQHQHQQHLAAHQAYRSARSGEETPPPPLSDTVSPNESPRARASRLSVSARRRAQGHHQQESRTGSEVNAPFVVGEDLSSSSLSASAAVRQRATSGGSEDDAPPNPPTPNGLDISMHSLYHAPTAPSRGRGGRAHAQPGYLQVALNRLSSPPPYSLDDELPPPGTSVAGSRRTSWLAMLPGFGRGDSSSQPATRHAGGQGQGPSRHASIGSIHSVHSASSSTEDDATHPNTSHVPGRTQLFANSLVNLLSERGLLTPLSTDTPDLASPGSEVPGANRGGGGEQRRDYFHNSRGPAPTAAAAASSAEADTPGRYESLTSANAGIANANGNGHANDVDLEARTHANTQCNSRSSSAGSAALAWVSSILGGAGANQGN